MPEVARERAILVGLELKGRGSRRSPNPAGPGNWDTEESMQELAVLADSAGAEVVEQVFQMREALEAATLIGSGKVEELAQKVRFHEADLVIFDRDLSPTQQRNLDKALGTKVVDRTQLILDIFARRARTREGQMQVELAQLNYVLPRLAGRGVEMSRLGGGIGTRGPGETQLETDRRRIFRRVRKIEEDLEGVRAGRTTQRRQRQAVPLATLSLVGYTNAGKSTLFNRLTRSDVLADARMFATLDPTVRQFVLPSNRRVLMGDTVGFIRHLPTTLVKAFRATLEEVTEAALLLHVVDASSPHVAQNMQHVSRVLAEIGAETTPQIVVMNKVDLLASGEIDRSAVPPGTAIAAVSAQTGEGVRDLLTRVDELLPHDPVAKATFRFPHGAGSAMHVVHEYAKVLETRHTDEYVEMLAEAPESVRKRLARFVVEP